ncbi:uncharacterized protein EAE97_000565 [Botrytis byssoidea]|uniref:Uncharacterized protein n=1 Tax=Botrytis byssoidea TaxID=139641 RepID=A0A9P5IVL7_9HELO|nr:uncharacterized protein EAE97_000565 [Botrytis byssoidea]KAF7955306.1 hypothetical protein EAE97_000565 [Botrytis byssoidea]
MRENSALIGGSGARLARALLSHGEATGEPQMAGASPRVTNEDLYNPALSILAQNFYILPRLSSVVLIIITLSLISMYGDWQIRGSVLLWTNQRNLIGLPNYLTREEIWSPLVCSALSDSVSHLPRDTAYRPLRGPRVPGTLAWVHDVPTRSLEAASHADLYYSGSGCQEM